MNALMNPDPYAALRYMPEGWSPQTAVSGYDENGAPIMSTSIEPPSGWFDSLKPYGFESKYNQLTQGVDENGNPVVYATLQQPGAHKYDTMVGMYQQGADGRWQLANDPSTWATRQVSESQNMRDALDTIGATAATAGLMYAGGVGMAGLGTPGVGTLGTIAPGSGAVPSLSGVAPLTGVTVPSLGAAGAGAAGAASSLPSWLGPAINAGVGLIGQNAAINASQRGTDAGINLLREMNAQNRADNQPLLDLRNSVLPRINALMQDPKSVQNDPGYQFGLNQGQTLINNRQAASGNYYSGGAMKELQRYGQDYAGSKLNDSLNRLLGVAQMGQIGGNNQQQANTNFGNQAGNALMQGGANRGSGYMGMANNVGGAVNDWFNNWQRNQLGGP